MSAIDSVQKYLDDIYPSTSTIDGISVRLELTTATVQTSLKWLIKQRRAIEVQPVKVVEGVNVPGVVQYQSTKSVRATSRGFNGSIDS